MLYFLRKASLFQLIKVKALPEKRSDIVDIVDIFRAKIVDVNRETMVIELSGAKDKIDACNKNQNMLTLLAT